MRIEETTSIPIRQDRATVLMGDAATLQGTLKAVAADHGAKRYPVTGWNSTQDSFRWELCADESGDYFVTLLIRGLDAEVQVLCGNSHLAGQVYGEWDRIELGTVHLSHGRNEITLAAPQPGRGLELYSMELISPKNRTRVESLADELRSNTAWMRQARYGLQFHWTSRSQPRHGARKPYAEAVVDFDEQAFAKMAYEAGAGYVMLTTSHSEHYFPAPIQAIDRLMPGRTTERDLVQDLAGALGELDIKLMLYYHCGHDHWNEPEGWWERTGFDPAHPATFVENWCSIMTEIGERYGESLAGWFFDDGCVYYPLNPPFETMACAAKAGDPGRVICYNSWIWPRFTDFQDYFCGEGYRWLKIERHLPPDGTGIFMAGPQRGLQAHTNFILEGSWVHRQSETPIPPPNVDRRTFANDMKKAIDRGIVPSVNLEIYQDGMVSEQSLGHMRAVKSAVRA